MAKPTITQQIASTRADRQQLLDRITYLAGAPLPVAEMRERVDAWIAHQAQRFDPAHQLRGLWRDGESSAMTANVTSSGILSHADLGPLFAWLAGDALEKALIEALEPYCDDSAPRSADRPEAIEALQREIHDLELKEETLIRQSEQTADPVMRRADADPAIVLQSDWTLAA